MSNNSANLTNNELADVVRSLQSYVRILEDRLQSEILASKSWKAKRADLENQLKQAKDEKEKFYKKIDLVSKLYSEAERKITKYEMEPFWELVVRRYITKRWLT